MLLEHVDPAIVGKAHLEPIPAVGESDLHAATVSSRAAPGQSTCYVAAPGGWRVHRKTAVADSGRPAGDRRIGRGPDGARAAAGRPLRYGRDRRRTRLEPVPATRSERIRPRILTLKSRGLNSISMVSIEGDVLKDRARCLRPLAAGIDVSYSPVKRRSCASTMNNVSLHEKRPFTA